MKILLRDFIAKVGGQNIFKPTTGYENLHQDVKNNGVRIVKFAGQKSGCEEHDASAPKHS